MSYATDAQHTAQCAAPSSSKGFDWRSRVWTDGERTLDQITLGVVGLGFTGLPLAAAMATAGHTVIGYDVDPDRIAALQLNEERRVGEKELSKLPELIAAARLHPTLDPGELSVADAIIISVPTPLRGEDPDLDIVIAASRTVASILRSGMLVVLESTTFPGTTRDIVLPILESSGLRCGKDFLLAYSPERLCPGLSFEMLDIPRLVGGYCETSAAAAQALYRSAFKTVVPVSSMEVAEGAKLLENVYRLVNISLINELKVYFDAAKVPVWEVVQAAASKPYGFMPFWPGLGAGGHCIPVDPRYLLWNAAQIGVRTPLLEQACATNAAIPEQITDRFEAALQHVARRALKGATVVVVGATYKANVADVRESPAVSIMSKLSARGAQVRLYDPILHNSQIRKLEDALNIQSMGLSDDDFANVDGILICTVHAETDLERLLSAGPPVFDPTGVSPSNKTLARYYPI